MKRNEFTHEEVHIRESEDGSVIIKLLSPNPEEILEIWDGSTLALLRDVFRAALQKKLWNDRPIILDLNSVKFLHEGTFSELAAFAGKREAPVYLEEPAANIQKELWFKVFTTLYPPKEDPVKQENNGKKPATALRFRMHGEPVNPIPEM